MKYWEFPWGQCSGCQDTARLVYGNRCENCGPNPSDCPHNMCEQPEWANGYTLPTWTVELTCNLCGATTTIDVGDVTTRVWKAE